MLDFEEIEQELKKVQRIIEDIKKDSFAAIEAEVHLNRQNIAQEIMRAIARELSVELRHNQIELLKPFIVLPNSRLDLLESNLQQLKLAYHAQLERYGWKKWGKENDNNQSR